MTHGLSKIAALPNRRTFGGWVALALWLGSAAAQAAGNPIARRAPGPAASPSVVPGEVGAAPVARAAGASAPAQPALASSPALSASVESALAPPPPVLSSEPSALPVTTPSVGEVQAAPQSTPQSTAELDQRPGVQLSTGAGVVRRSLGFTQDVYHRMRSLGADLYVVRLGAEIYPALQFRPLEGHLGLVAGYEGGVAGSVHDQNYGENYPLTHSEVFGGLRFRSALRGHELGFNLTLGHLRSALEDRGASDIPGVGYTEVRAGADAAFQFQKLHARIGAGFRVPLSYGEISHVDWFPHVGGYGVDLSADASYPLAERVAVTASASLRRFVLEMNSEPEDASGGVSEVAGGAVDSYFGGYLGLLFTL